MKGKKQLAGNSNVQKESNLITNAYREKLYQYINQVIEAFNSFKEEKLIQLAVVSHCNPYFEKYLLQENKIAGLLMNHPKYRVLPFLADNLYEHHEKCLQSLEQYKAKSKNTISSDRLIKIFGNLIEECEEYTQVLSLLPKYQPWIKIIDQYQREISILRCLYQWSDQLFWDIDVLDEVILQSVSLDGLFKKGLIEELKEIKEQLTKGVVSNVSELIYNQLDGFRWLISDLSRLSSKCAVANRAYQDQCAKNKVKVLGDVKQDQTPRATTYLEFRKKLEDLLKPWEESIKHTQEASSGKSLNPLKKKRQHIQELEQEVQATLDALEAKKAVLKKETAAMFEWANQIEECEKTLEGRSTEMLEYSSEIEKLHQKEIASQEEQNEKQIKEMEKEHNAHLKALRDVFEEEIMALYEQHQHLLNHTKESNEFLKVEQRNPLGSDVLSLGKFNANTSKRLLPRGSGAPKQKLSAPPSALPRPK